jgi:hypothetical protein
MRSQHDHQNCILDPRESRLHFGTGLIVFSEHDDPQHDEAWYCWFEGESTKTCLYLGAFCEGLAVSLQVSGRSLTLDT